ncbi:MAG: hypothetical protein KJ077_35765 [Anaerolineae bacterium]|nr:hypothetical protein [Anaerolineae bacterium]
MDDDFSRKIHPRTLIPARTNRKITRSNLPAIPAGSECAVWQIQPLEGYSLVEGLPCYALWNFEYVLLERPKHQCTNPRCACLFSLADGHNGHCPRCTYPIIDVP